MDNGGESEEDQESCEEKELDPSTKGVTSKRFNPSQLACLKVYYANGMTRTDRKHAAVICRAADDSGLTIKQVKV